jgi:hypothetical protein
MVKHIQLMTAAGVVHVTNLTPPGSDNPTRGCPRRLATTGCCAWRCRPRARTCCTPATSPRRGPGVAGLSTPSGFNLRAPVHVKNKKKLISKYFCFFALLQHLLQQNV